MSSKLEKVHPFIADAVAKWFRDNPDGLDIFRANNVRARLVQKIATGDCSERTIYLVEKPLVEICKIDLQRLTFKAAMNELPTFILEDLEENGIVSYDLMLKALESVCNQIGRGKTRHIINMFAERFDSLLEGKLRASVSHTVRILELIYKHKNGLELPKVKNYPKKSRLRTKEAVPTAPVVSTSVPQLDVRYLLGAALSTITIQTNSIEKLLACQPEVVLDGDRVKAIGIFTKLLKALGVTPEVLQRINTQNPVRLEDWMNELVNSKKG